MSKRKHPRSKTSTRKPETAETTSSPEAPRTSLNPLDVLTVERPTSILEYLTIRNISIGVIIGLGLVFIALFPGHYENSLSQSAREKMSNGDYQGALRSLKSRKFWFGGNLEKLPAVPAAANRSSRITGAAKTALEYAALYYIQGAYCLYLDGKTEEAESLLSEMPTEGMGRYLARAYIARYYAMRGVLETEKGNWESALKLFDRALVYRDIDPVANFYVGKRLFELGKMAEATLYLKRVTDANFTEEAGRMLAEAREKVLTYTAPSG